jgi:hypothetical protein
MTPLMTDDYQPMVLDRCVISTHFEITPEVITDRVLFNQKHSTDILDNDPRSRQVAGQNQKSQKLVFSSYGGIVVFTDEVSNGRWFANRIHFNPRNVLFRHNGHRICIDDFTIALTILREQVSKILKRPADIIHIVPGLHPHSNSFWSTLEITVDLADPDGQLEERVFKNPHHPKMKESFRHREGTVQIGSPDGPCKIRFYRKDKQMQKLLRKHRIAGAPRVFRIELVLSQGKLLEHLGSANNSRIIEGTNRLVRFSPADLIECFLRIVTRLQGCYRVVDAGAVKGAKMDKTSRFMAWVATRYNIPLVDLLDLYETQIGCSDETMGRQRRAAYSMMARISPVRFEEIFSTANLQRQPSIVIPELEATVAYRRQYVMGALDIEMNYGQPLPFPLRYESAQKIL